MARIVTRHQAAKAVSLIRWAGNQTLLLQWQKRSVCLLNNPLPWSVAPMAVHQPGGRQPGPMELLTYLVNDL